jgi:hypothetical protein
MKQSATQAPPPHTLPGAHAEPSARFDHAVVDEDGVHT